MGKTKRAALYHRVSTKEQAKEGYSLADQEHKTRTYAESKGYEVVGSYTDAGNASRDTIQRPELQKLKGDAEARKFDVVVVVHPDRLGAGDALHAIIYLLSEEHVHVEFVEVEYSGSHGELIRSIDAWKASDELARIRTRAHNGRKQKSREGKAAPMPTPLYGYIYNVLTKLHEVEPEQAAIVRRVFDLYTSGVGPGHIAAMLNSEGVPTGKNATKGWTTDRVSRLVTYEQYASGERIANRLYGAKERERNGLSRNAQRAESEWIPIPDTYPPIITEEVWRKAVAQRQVNTTVSKYNRTSEVWLLAGKLYCAECGYKFAAKMHTAKQKKRLASFWCEMWEWLVDLGCSHNRYSSVAPAGQ